MQYNSSMACLINTFYTLSFEFLYFSRQVYTFMTVQYINVCDAVCFYCIYYSKCLNKLAYMSINLLST
jgi:hypothetical protein